MKPFRPMLAASTNVHERDLASLTWPKLCSIKEDGVRLTQRAQDAHVLPFSRSMHILPNCHVQAWCDDHGIPGLDGEIVVEGMSFHDIQSKVMSHITLPFDFTYMVFDHCGYLGKPYLQRLQIAKNLIERYQPARVQLVKQHLLHSPKAVIKFYEKQIAANREGIILRDPYAPYKQGRATYASEWLLKMKHMVDAEAEILSIEEEMENLSPSETSAIGLTRRRKRKDSLRGKGTMGHLVVRNCTNGEEFKIGSGFTQALKNWFWANRTALRGEIVTYNYQVHGTKEKPRTPIFKGIRKD